jgi:Rrf2 family protein
MATLLNFSEAAALALHAAGHLALRQAETPRADAVMSARALAQACGASEAHMVKVCQALARRGLLASRRGAGGGFTLARGASRIRLLDVYAAIEGPVRLRSCLFRDHDCRTRSGHDCIYGRRVRAFEENFLQYLKGTTLAAVAAECLRERAA